MLVFAGGASFAESCFGLEFVHEFYAPGVLLGELPVVVLVYYLQFVGKLVGADFVYLEEVDGCWLGVNVEVPDAVDLTS